MRMISPKHLGRGKEDLWDTSGVLIEDLPDDGAMDFAEIFGNTRPAEMEIGTGKGTFILARSQARPEVNFIGVEYARSYALYAADRFRRHGIENVRMLHADAGKLFAGAVGEQSLQRLHIYFPDPWPKRKHNRRRLIQPPFIERASRALTIGGQLLIVTDHMGYFEQIRSVMSAAPGLTKIAMPQMASADGELVGTNFERKYIAQGRPFYSTAHLRYA